MKKIIFILKTLLLIFILCGCSSKRVSTIQTVNQNSIPEIQEDATISNLVAVCCQIIEENKMDTSSPDYVWELLRKELFFSKKYMNEKNDININSNELKSYLYLINGEDKFPPYTDFIIYDEENDIFTIKYKKYQIPSYEIINIDEEDNEKLISIRLYEKDKTLGYFDFYLSESKENKFNIHMTEYTIGEEKVIHGKLIEANDSNVSIESLNKKFVFDYDNNEIKKYLLSLNKGDDVYLSICRRRPRPLSEA